ncbi:MAG: hypothetical protein IJT73_12060 [Selenomonadaceae bacterium]|nr:hypothetical protein [Selenomonadaceae bacterium]
MRKNYNALLLIAALWLLCTVISPRILSRAVDLSLAISFLSQYIQSQFPTTSRQRVWLVRSKNFSLVAAAVFLILEIYFLFIA